MGSLVAADVFRPRDISPALGDPDGTGGTNTVECDTRGVNAEPVDSPVSRFSKSSQRHWMLEDKTRVGNADASSSPDEQLGYAVATVGNAHDEGSSSIARWPGASPQPVREAGTERIPSRSVHKTGRRHWLLEPT